MLTELEADGAVGTHCPAGALGAASSSQRGDSPMAQVLSLDLNTQWRSLHDPGAMETHLQRVC